jgi:PAS domain S-box-containing protein
VLKHILWARLWAFLLVIVVVPLLCTSPSEANHHRTQRHVLLLHSYHKGMTWVDDITTSVTSTLKKSNPDIEFHVEYMDTKRVIGDEHLRNLYTEYRYKFSRQKFDAVVVADDTALRFALKYYNYLFPGAPVVFCGINNLEPGMLDNHPQFTGILEDVDVDETLKIALALHPAARRVYIINETSESGKGLHKAIAKAMTPFSDRASFTFLENYTIEELATLVARLPSDSIILRSAFWVDKAGHTLPNERVSIEAIDRHAVVPEYSLWDFYMGLGIVGGKLVSGTAQGECAAQLVGRILRGEKPSAIPVVKQSPNRLMFDYLQLQRFGIKRSALPAGSVIINEPLPFYAINKTITWIGALFTLVVSCFSILLVLNIRSRKRTEKSLRESKERLKGIFETSQAGIFLCETGGKLAFCNSRLAEMLACDTEELSGTNYNDYLHETEKTTVDNVLQRLLTGGTEHVAMKQHFVSKDGTDFWGYVSASRLDGDDGGLKTLVGVITDISELKRATDELEAEKEQLSVTLGSIGDGVITVDTDGRVIMLNGVAEQLCGWDQKDATGKPLVDVFNIINEKTGRQQENPVTTVLETGGIVELANNTILIALDGTRRVIADSAAPIRDKGGNVTGVVLVFRDMTEKQAIEEELFKARKLESLGVLAGGIAHDFNNLLTGILGNVSLAKILMPAGEKPYMFLENAEKASLRARELTQQLLTFSKGGAPVRKTTSIAQLLTDAASFVLRGSNVRCDFDIAGELWPVEADEGQMSQVFNNLIINADQAMPDGGVVTVRAENILGTMDGNVIRSVRICIEDSGVGIQEANLSRIFDPYFTTKANGSGLGLATVYSIVKRHDGEIAVKSQPGIGTSISIHLPADTVETPQESLPSKGSSHGSGKVLVMDDEEIIRSVAAEILLLLGYEPVLCGDGAEALEICRKEAEKGTPFAAVIMDLTIPGGMGGKEAIEKLLAQEPSARVIVSSGYSNDPIMGSYREYGFCGAVTKPYHTHELGAVLAEVLMENA